MRDTELLLSLLREMGNKPHGRTIVKTFLGMDEQTQQRHHHAELLVDAGHAEWSEGLLRITNDGYDFLNAIDADPKHLEQFHQYFNTGARYADAAMRIVDTVSKAAMMLGN